MKKLKSTAASKGNHPAPSAFLSDAEFHRLCEEGRAEVRRMTVPQKRAWLIQIGALNPDGTLRTYDLSDHVPLGPRS